MFLIVLIISCTLKDIKTIKSKGEFRKNDYQARLIVHARLYVNHGRWMEVICRSSWNLRRRPWGFSFLSAPPFSSRNPRSVANLSFFFLLAHYCRSSLHACGFRLPRRGLTKRITWLKACGGQYTSWFRTGQIVDDSERFSANKVK